MSKNGSVTSVDFTPLTVNVPVNCHDQIFVISNHSSVPSKKTSEITSWGSKGVCSIAVDTSGVSINQRGARDCSCSHVKNSCVVSHEKDTSSRQPVETRVVSISAISHGVR